MSILWITNIPPAYGPAHAAGPSSVFGGWISSVGLLLEGSPQHRPRVAFPSRDARHSIEWASESDNGDIRFRPVEHVTDKTVDDWRRVLRQINPEIVHIFGTELPHSLAVARAARREALPVIVTLQGLVSVIAQHMSAGLDEVGLRGMTVRSAIRGDSIRGLRRTYLMRGNYELETLRLANHIIGRTEWDKACAAEMAPQAVYHELNETLRESFYSGAWSSEKCIPKTVFMSQARNPLKGLHFALNALSVLRQIRHPDATLTVAGPPAFRENAFSQRVLGTQFGSIIRAQVRELDLVDAVHFVGLQTEDQMKRRLLGSHVFLSASSIENESNSLSEAKALGVPCVASYVGGVASRLVHGTTGYHYQHDAPYMAAHFIAEVFENPVHAAEMGRAAQREVRLQLDPSRNLAVLTDIYKKVAEGDI